MSPEGIQEVMGVLEARGWSARDLNVLVMPHLLPKLSPDEASAVREGLRNAGMTEHEMGILTPDLVTDAAPAPSSEPDPTGITDALTGRAHERRRDEYDRSRAEALEPLTSELVEASSLRLRRITREEKDAAVRNPLDYEMFAFFSFDREWLVSDVSDPGGERLIVGLTDQELSNTLAWQWNEPQQIKVVEDGAYFLYRGRFLKYLGGSKFEESGFSDSIMSSAFRPSLEDQVKQRIRAEFGSSPATNRQAIEQLQESALPSPEADTKSMSQREFVIYLAERRAQGSPECSEEDFDTVVRSAYEDGELSEEEYYNNLQPGAVSSRIRKPIPEGVRHSVWRRDQGRCVQCDSQEKLELDHIIPLSRGGSNTERNLQLLCETCNRRKGALI